MTAIPVPLTDSSRVSLLPFVMVRLSADADPVIASPLVVGAEPSRPVFASPPVTWNCPSFAVMVSLPKLWVTETMATGIVLPGSVTVWADGANVEPAVLFNGVIVWRELVPVELKGIGVDEVGRRKVPVPAEVKGMA